MNKKKEIQKIYDNFSTELKSNEFSAVRKALSNISNNNKNDKKYLHNLGKFVIFYSLPSLNPEVMIIGDNPSWFHKKDPLKAKNNLGDVAGRIPKINSYKIHDHTFGKQIRDVFDLIEKEEWLDKVVGLNRFWIQTGGGGTEELKKECEKIEAGVIGRLEKLCERKTRQLVEILNPKIVILLGKKAQNSFSSQDRMELNFQFCDAIHPARGKWRQTALEINSFIKEKKIKL